MSDWLYANLIIEKLKGIKNASNSDTNNIPKTNFSNKDDSFEVDFKARYNLDEDNIEYLRKNLKANQFEDILAVFSLDKNKILTECKSCIASFAKYFSRCDEKRVKVLPVLLQDENFIQIYNAQKGEDFKFQEHVFEAFLKTKKPEKVLKNLAKQENILTLLKEFQLNHDDLKELLSNMDNFSELNKTLGSIFEHESLKEFAKYLLNLNEMIERFSNLSKEDIALYDDIFAFDDYKEVRQAIAYNYKNLDDLREYLKVRKYGNFDHHKTNFLFKTHGVKISDPQKANLLEGALYLNPSQLSYAIRKKELDNILPKCRELGESLKELNKASFDVSTKYQIFKTIFDIDERGQFPNYSFKTKMEKLSAFRFAQQNKELSKETKSALGIDSWVQRLQDSIDHVITPIQVSGENMAEMFKGFFANNSPDLDELFKNADFSLYEKNGLPLKYPRDEFIFNITSILNKLSKDQKEEILKKLEITLTSDNNGYDGVINLYNLNSENEIEKQIKQIAHKFIFENSIQTNNKNLNDSLNSLIKGMPEFINIIGKKQHATHDFSTDIHILTVLQNIIKNPQYSKLSNYDKTCLKFASILHDISKAEGINDSNHAFSGAMCAKDILEKYKFDLKTKNRIYELIRNHHWLADYNNQIKNAKDIAVDFRRATDFKLAQILAEADLKAVKKDGSFYEKYKDALSSQSQKPILDELQNINRSAQFYLTNKIINSKKIPLQTLDSETYKVINFNKISPDFDLQQYGFEPNTTLQNLRLFVHTVNESEIAKLENVLNLSKPNYEGFLCSSYVSLDDKSTYFDNIFGLSLEAQNYNIANSSTLNQGSGYEKNYKAFIKTLTDETPDRRLYRENFAKRLREELNINEKEYIELFEKIQDFEYASNFDYIESIKIGEKEFSGKLLKEALSEACDYIIDNKKPLKHNEVNLYLPKANAIIAKVSDLSELPKQLLHLAKNYDLPIFLLGRY